jgi:hypothetical protein
VSAWDVRLFQRHREDDPAETCPAETFLDECPESVAADLIAIIDAVAEGPPPQFRGGGMWEAMHGAMRGFYEDRIAACTDCFASLNETRQVSIALRWC